MSAVPTARGFVAIVGISGRFPGAPSARQFWDNVKSGVESIAAFTDEDLRRAGVPPDKFRRPDYVRARGILTDVEDFDAEFFRYAPREAEVTDPQHRILLECAWEAIEDAGHDVARFAGPIGVYAGGVTSSYASVDAPALGDDADPLEARIANDLDVLATRISYKLNLTGPSLTVQAACSTSLVAVHLACQALRSGDCDMALAGAVSIHLPQARGYRWRPGGIGSRDGRCRAFDAEGDGTVGGNGAGVVVLRRLEDAIADRDHIYAVIRGTAINNDGQAKVGFTAPSVDGQARVIAAAHAAAGVSADSISYVEAHGTGTRLGDPVEVAALTRAFGLPPGVTGVCALGSVKTNIGHLDAAAGMAGLIKVAFALSEGVLPPSLHFRRANPLIQLEQTPFFVPGEARAWPRTPSARRAGVSAFGVGGTNVHVVLEEAPEPAPSPRPRRCHVVPISARTALALEAATRNIVEHIASDGAPDLADVVHTLQVGRSAWKHRRAIVGADARDVVEAVQRRRPQVVATGMVSARPRVAFMFPGGGSQYVDMGKGLYGSEPVFRQVVDACADMLVAHLGRDLREVLYPGPESLATSQALLLTSGVALPALFVTELALAQLWRHWGIEPFAMIGHSLGEYVAGCVAGVFTLADALAVVAFRGRLMDRISDGAMLVVRRSPEQIEAHLGPEVCLAAVNAPELCVVSAPAAVIAALEARLSAAGVESSRVKISVASHSALVDPILPEFEAFVAGIPLSAPSIPYVSNVTGTWITDSEARDPRYWASHLRHTVRFADGLHTLLGDPDAALLEVGPGVVLGTFVGLHPLGGGRVTVASLRHPMDPRSDEAFVAMSLGQLWVAGIEIAWPRVAGDGGRRVALPTYPFERRRYWPTPSPGLDATPASSTREPGPAPGEPVRTGGVYERPALSTEYAAPSDEIETVVARLWEQALGIDGIGAHDSFVELGGHSLLAMRLLAELRAKLAVPLSAEQFWAAPTVAGVARVARAQQGAADGAAPAARRTVADLEREVTLSLDAADLPARDSAGPGAVLMTGATGFVGAFVLAELLGTSTDPVHCLVRAESAGAGAARIERALRSWELWKDDWRERIVAEPGDLERPEFGWPPRRVDDLASRIGTIVHSAATVNFMYPYPALRSANVAGTEHVVRFAARRRLKRIDFVSTIGVLPLRTEGGACFDETADAAANDVLHSPYAETKWVAEQIVRRAGRLGIPCTVFRLGSVVGDTGQARCNPSDFIWRMLLGSIQIGVAPRRHALLHLVPVDHVARVIAGVSRRGQAIGRVLHVVPPEPVSWAQLFHVARACGFTADEVPYDVWRDRLGALGDRAQDNALFPLLPQFAPSLFAEEGRPSRFRGPETDALLSGSGLQCPPVDTTLMRRYIQRLVGRSPVGASPPTSR